MTIKTILNYSPNFDPNKRHKEKIIFLIFHYSGMKTQQEAINRLTNIQSQVSSHYIVKKNGEILRLIPDSYIAWHAGISSWKKYKSLNKNSIGIEIINPGHDHGYESFTNKQVKSLIKLSKYLIKKYNLKNKNILGHSDIAPDRKKDPGEKFPWKLLSKKKIGIWHSLKSSKLVKIRKKKTTPKEKAYFLRLLKKIGYSVKNKSRSIKAFQRHFRPEIIDGVVDLECLKIIVNLSPKLK